LGFLNPGMSQNVSGHTIAAGGYAPVLSHTHFFFSTDGTNTFIGTPLINPFSTSMFTAEIYE